MNKPWVVNRIVVATVLVSLSLAAKAAEPHFTFSVPVELNNLAPEITNYRVSCAVASLEKGVIGQNQVTGSVTGGNVNTVVTVPITVAESPIKRADDATEYVCSLHLSGEGFIFMDDANVRFETAPGAPLVRRASGPLP